MATTSALSSSSIAPVLGAGTIGRRIAVDVIYVGLSGLRGLHGTQCFLLTVFFFSLLLWFLFSRKGLS